MSQPEQHSFQAEIQQLLSIVIHSLYTDREVFVRELVSNAADACEKLRFLQASGQSPAGDSGPAIAITADEKESTLTIADTGIGMTRDELVQNLGTIAHSGTKAFLKALAEQQKPDTRLIGQFGVGFYSAFLVANKVVVTSKSNDDEQHVWTSTADAKFFVTKDPRGDTLGRGTRVTLHLKDDAVEYVEQDKIKNLVKKYSEFI